MALIKSCYLCESSNLDSISEFVRDNPVLTVKKCLDCGLLFLSSFDHINDDLYGKSGMHESLQNINDWLRETANDDQRRYEYCLPIVTDKKVLDFGCGNGGFLLRIKDSVKSLVGVDLEMALSSHFDDQGIAFANELNQVSGQYDVITLFHVLEHLPDPAAILNKLKQLLSPGGQIIIEVPNANDALLTIYESEAFSNFTYWSFHLFIFNADTLRLIFKRIGANIRYIKYIQRYSLANHLYWITQGKPDGDTKWSFINSTALTKCYENQLAALGMTDTLFASIYFKE